MYPGGKNGSGTYQQIINFIPEHQIYIELFAGSAAIYFNKLRATNSILVELDETQAGSLNNKLLDRSDIVLNENAISFIQNAIPIFNLLNKSGNSVFCYADPPYLFETRKQQKKIYDHELTHQDHINFLKVARSVQFPMIISHYENKLYNEQLKGWKTHSYNSMKRGGITIETIYYNFEKPERLHDYRYLGDTFRKRALVKLTRKNMMLKLNRLDPQLRNAILTDIKNELL